MKCPSCGADNFDTARSCSCGHKFSASSVREARRRAAGQSNLNEGEAFHNYTRREVKRKQRWVGRNKVRKQTPAVTHNSDLVLSEIEDGGCWFCNRGFPQSDSGLSVEMVRPAYVRTNDIGIPTYENPTPTATVVVPRCATCKKAHERWLGYGGVGMAAGVFLGMSGCSLALYRESERGTRKAFLIGLAILAGSIIFWFLVGALIGAIMPAPKGIKRASYGRKHPDVQRLEQQGWQVDRLETAG